MKVHTISSADGKLLAITNAPESAKVKVRVRARENQHIHELELPEEARSLKPQEIFRRLRIHAPGQKPVYVKE
jgi:hypothetical protein